MSGSGIMGTGTTAKFARILFVEDNPDDVELELVALCQGGLTVDHDVVQTADDLQDALAGAVWDIIICDYCMPELSGLEAIAVARRCAPLIPFILVSGTVGEDVAVGAMRAGADDYVLKDNLTRLASAVHRELRDADARRSGALSERALRLLAEIGAAVGGSLDRDRAVREVPALLVRELARLCVIDLVEPDGSSRSAAAAHADSERAAQLHLLDLGALGPGVLGKWMAQTGGAPITQLPAAVVGSQMEEADPGFARLANGFGLRSGLLAPILCDQQVAGAIKLAREGPYSPLEVRIVEEIAARIAGALKNAALYEQAQRAIQIRDEFLSIASHELRTPLTALQLQLQGVQDLLRRGSLEASAGGMAKRLERCGQSIKRLGQLIEGLLDVSRISGGRLRLSPEPLDLVCVVREVIERFQEEAHTARCALTLQAGPSANGSWDRMRLEQVLTNLLANAIKYGAGKPIELHVADGGDAVTVQVVDNGIGIPAADLQRIFGQFERAVSSRNYGGLGLGLFITRRIVEAHGGTISAGVLPSGGATFLVTLPKQAVATEEASGPVPRPPDPRLSEPMARTADGAGAE